MKKLLFVAIIAIGAISANAQVKFGVKAGLNFAKQTASVSGGSVSTNSMTGFHAGIISEFNLSENLVLQPGLLFSQKGAKISFGGSDYTDIYNYLDIPINLMYKINVDGAKILLFTGPSLSYALSGKEKVGDNSVDIEFGSGDNQMRRFDLGFGIGGGLEFGSIQATANYNFGLANISNSTDAKLKNNVFSISVAYLFGGK